jgi:hypothetical protein
MLGDVSSDCLRAWSCVAFKGANGGVPRAGQQNGRVDAVLGSMRQRRVPELMERPATGGRAEQLRGAAI